KIGRDVLSGLLLEQRAPAPRTECVGPRLDLEHIIAGFCRRESRGPAVVAVEPHRRSGPLFGAVAPPAHRSVNQIVAVAKDVGPNRNWLAGDALDRGAATIYRRINFLKTEARAVGCRLQRLPGA